jgi:putative transposase
MADAALSEQISHIHQRRRGTYGAPRIHAELHFEGILCGRKRVARLMRAAGIRGCCRGRKKHTTTRKLQQMLSVPDLVERQFTPQAPDRLWVANITYLRSF